jgi:hypothetical protein
LTEEAASSMNLGDGQACIGGRPPRWAGGAARSGLQRRASSHGWVTSSTVGDDSALALEAGLLTQVGDLVG